MTSRISMVTALLAVVAVSTSPLLGRDEVSLQRALDRQIELGLENARIGDLFDALRKATGVRFVLDPEALSALPYGEETRLDVKVKNVTLRKALSPILARQGLRWEIDAQTIRVQPTEALARMGRRATFEELDTLGKLYTVQLKDTSEGGPVIQQLRELEGQKDLRLLPHVSIDPQADYARADQALPGTAAQWLDMLCHGKDWTWYVWGDQIIILDKATQVRRQLEKHVTLSYQNAQLVKILLDLARKSGVKLTLTPGVMGYLPESTRESFNLTMADASVEQALQVISGATGLQFVKAAEGVLVQASEQLKAKGKQARQRSQRPRFFVRFTVDVPGGAKLDVLMRPEELPPDVLEMIEKAKDELIVKLRSAASAEKGE